MDGKAPRLRRFLNFVVAFIVEILLLFTIFIIFIAVDQLIGIAKASPLAVIATICVGSILSSFVMWAAYYYIYVRRHSTRRSAVYFFVFLLITVPLAGFVCWMEKDTASRQAVEEKARATVADRLALDEISAAEAVISSPRGGTFSMHQAAATSPAGQIGIETRAWLFESLNAGNDYGATATRLDYPNFMSASHISADQGMVQTQAKLEHIRAAILAREKRIDLANATFRTQIVAAKVDDALKRPVLARFDAWRAAQAIKRNYRTVREINIVDEFESQMRELNHERGSWRAIGDRMEFYDAHAQSLYQAHSRNIFAMSREVDIASQN